MIDITNEVPEKATENFENLIKETILSSLEYEGIEGEQEVSVVICDNEKIHQLNLEFREKDAPTDVLSFPLFEDGELGDIVISFEMAEKQAKEYGHSLEREIAFLTAHSVLHLLGYDHEVPEEEKEMFTKQEEILQKLGLVR